MAGETTGWRIWIDQDLCTGDGLCEETLPAVFGSHEDGLFYVKEKDWPNIYGADGTSPDREPAVRHGQGTSTRPDFVTIHLDLLEAAQEAADHCPGECIFIEPAE